MRLRLNDVCEFSFLFFFSSDSSDLTDIQRITGVCPQHDVVFDLLTPREHLQFFARIRVRMVSFHKIAKCGPYFNAVAPPRVFSGKTKKWLEQFFFFVIFSLIFPRLALVFVIPASY